MFSLAYKNSMEISFKSKSENEAFARVVVAAFASQLDPTINELADIKTAVSEAVTNAIIHGYNDEGKDVVIKSEIDGNTIMISVEDSGVGIDDIDLATQPLYTSKPELERSGMGFTVMESFMDQINVDSQNGIGTKVTMVKTIGSTKDGE